MTTLARYEIVDTLGTGSMGTVYRARDTVLDREVALKTIRTGMEVEPELRERFYREARACARLHHPYIVVVYDLGEVDRTAYIAMELLNGLDFRKLIEARTNIRLPVKVEAMAQVCEALAHAHRHGIIHRDIKPSNLFLVDDRMAKVLDFGIARLPSSKLTVAGKILGTPNYMAPEQILVKSADARADLFSAAVVFFEFLVFAHPFKSDVIPRRIVEGEPDSLFDYDSKLPVLLEKILNRALAKDPDMRYRSGDEMAADLRAVLGALLQNSSPTFSQTQLPSDREIRAAAAPLALFDADTSLLRPPPPGEDPHEWHLSELMRLIPEFEAAAGRRDKASARHAFRQLEAIGAVDSRFVDAVQMCRARLGELESATGAAEEEHPFFGAQDSTVEHPVAVAQPGTATGGEPGTTPKTCGYCGASNRRAASYCIKCGGRLPAAAAAEPAPQAQASEPVPVDVGATAIGQGPTPLAVPEPDLAEVEAPPVAREPVSMPARRAVDPLADLKRIWAQTLQWLAIGWKRLIELPPKQRRLVGGVAGAVFCLVLSSFLIPRRPIPRQKWVATALVEPARATLYRDKQQAASIGTLMRGDPVNLLEVPVRDQILVRIQFVGRKVLQPGYMRISDLGGWDSADPEVKLALVRWFWSGRSANDDDVRNETAKLQQLVDQFPGTKAAHEAQFEMAELELSVVRRMQNAGEPESAWHHRIESARSHVEAAKGEPSVSGRVEGVLVQIAGLQAAAVAAQQVNPPVNLVSGQTGSGNTSPAQPKKASKKKIDKLLKELREFDPKINNATEIELDEAQQKVDEILRLEYDNSEATEFQKKIAGRRRYLKKWG
jgi:serine/threonine protein kinase